MVAKLAIIDMDNCISNDLWRVRFINDLAPNNWLKYHSYHLLCHLDNHENGHHLTTFRELGMELIIFTARPEFHRIRTENWLKARGIEVVDVWMRADRDDRASHEIKRDMLKRLRRNQNIEVAAAIDDHEDIVQMYKSEGVPYVRQIECYKRIAG